jgi:hypothetical protein
VRLYSRVLSEAEMRALYEGEEQLVSAECLEALWPLERDEDIKAVDRLGLAIVDVSGHERHLCIRSPLMYDSPSFKSRYQVDGAC